MSSREWCAPVKRIPGLSYSEGYVVFKSLDFWDGVSDGVILIFVSVVFFCSGEDVTFLEADALDLFEFVAVSVFTFASDLLSDELSETFLF